MALLIPNIEDLSQVVSRRLVKELSAPSAKTPEGIRTVLQNVLQTISKVEEALSILGEAGDLGGGAATRPVLKYEEGTLVKTGNSKKTGRGWRISITQKEIKTVLPHIARKGEKVMPATVAKASKMNIQKLYVLLGVLEDLGFLEHQHNKGYVRTEQAIDRVFEKLEKLNTKG